MSPLISSTGGSSGPTQIGFTNPALDPPQEPIETPPGTFLPVTTLSANVHQTVAVEARRDNSETGRIQGRLEVPALKTLPANENILLLPEPARPTKPQFIPLELSGGIFATLLIPSSGLISFTGPATIGETVKIFLDGLSYPLR